MAANNIGPSTIAKDLGLGRSLVYRVRAVCSRGP
jgi:hypothetical protein